MCRLCVVAFLTAVAWPAAAGALDEASEQPTPPPAPVNNAIYGEFLGNALIYSVNYERRVAQSDVWARVGFEVAGEPPPVAIVPAMIEWLVGRGSNHLELGAGVITAPPGKNHKAGLLATAVIGFRHQRPEGGLVFRIGVTPFFHGGGFSEGPPIIWFGISVGKSF